MPSTLDIEEVDLASLTEALRARLGPAVVAEELPGRTAVRDVVADRLGCSMLEAEHIVDTLVARAFVRFERGRYGRPSWHIG